jgi:rhodanese-related sulfurtransferase
MKKYFRLSVLWLLLGMVLIVACGGSKVDGITRLSNEQFKKEAAQPNRVILDVRTPEEFEAGHLAGAIMIDYLDTENFSKEVVKLDHSKHYLLYCRSGKRSLNAANLMKSKGFKHVSDLKDGITGWQGQTVTGKK